MNVTVLGAGIMGSGVVRSLLRGGFDVTVWNRTTARAELLATEGATVAESVAHAVSSAEAVLSTLFDEDAVVHALSAAAEHLPATAVWVQASTIGVNGTARVQQLARDHDVALVEAMMLGTKAPAESGRLVLLTAGDEALLARVDPVLQAISAKVVSAGTTVGKATALKLVCNAWIATINAATAQSIALAEALDVEPRQFLAAIEGGPVDSPVAHAKGELMLTSAYDASFMVDGVSKDVGLIREAAATAGVDDTLLEALASLYSAASSAGHGSDDMAAVVESFRPQSSVSAAARTARA